LYQKSSEITATKSGRYKIPRNSTRRTAPPG
jgi:hypothetical protein